MTSRERVRAALAHKEADRIPVDSGAMHSSGTSAMVYNQLKAHLGITTGETRVYDVIQQLAIPEQWFLDRFRVDTVDLARAFAVERENWVDWPLPDGSPGKFPAWIPHEKRGDSWVCLNGEGDVVASMEPNEFYFNQTTYPFYGLDVEDFSDLPRAMEKVSWMALRDQLWKDSDHQDFWRAVGRTARKLYEETDYSIVANYSSLIFEPGQWFYRNDDFFVKLLTEPQEMHALFEKLTEIHIQRLDKYLDQVGPYADVLVTSDDLGMQTGPLLSRELYREMIFPWHREIYQFVKKKCDIKIFLHSCGGIYDLLPDLIEAGVDIINPVQTSAVGMDPRRLKEEFGRDLVFWGGGVDNQHTLTGADTATVQEEVRRNCEIFMKDGGFVFNHIHNLLPGIPPENIVAMFDAVNQHAVHSP